MISLTQAVAEYVSKLLMLYQKFWQEASSEFHNSYAVFESVLRSYPEKIIKNEGEDPALFVYEIINGAAQAVPISSDCISMYEQFHQKADDLSEEYSNAYQQLMEGMLWVWRIDQKQIEIGIFVDHIGLQ